MSYSMMGYGLGGDLRAQARTNGCSTAGIAALDAQLVAEMVSLSEGKLSRVESAKVKYTSDRVHPYLITAARDALLRAAEGGEIKINSALRTFADQYLLHQGCRGAAVPGGSNHESGKAIDVMNWQERKAALLAAGFRQPVSTNPAYFEFPGDDLRKNSVKAFQKLWNLNNPTDRVEEDGVATAATMERIAKAPATGFTTVPVPAVVTPPVNVVELTDPIVIESSMVPVRYDEPRLPASGGRTDYSGLLGFALGLSAAAVIGLILRKGSKSSPGDATTPDTELPLTRNRSRSPRRNPKPKTYYTADGMPYAVEDVDLMSQSWFTGDRDPSGHEQMIAEIVAEAVQRGRMNPKRSGDILREARAEVRRILDHSPRRNPTTYVVEPECRLCGAPLGEGVTGVREMREGDKLGSRGLNDDEIPERFQAAAAGAHPRLAIKRWSTCSDCREY